MNKKWKKKENMQCRNISIRLNSTGEDVKKLQAYLRACKYYTRNIDGVFGSYMVESIKLLQKNQGNTPDGVFGPKTCKKTDLNKQVQNNHSPPQNKKTKETSELLIKYKKQPNIISYGPTSLRMYYSYYNHDYSIQYLKKLCNTLPHGISPQELINATTKVDKNYKLIEENY